MATSKPNDLRWWRGRGLVKTILTLIVVTAALVGVLFLFAGFGATIDTGITPGNPGVIQQAVQIPNLNGVIYLSGSVDKLVQLESIVPAPAACRFWQGLSEANKRGLAFVDAKAVPSCAAKRYVATAKAEHRRRPNYQYIFVGHASYYDLGAAPAPSEYLQEHYSCSDLKRWVQQNYVPPPMQKLSDDELTNLMNLENFAPDQMTAKQRAELAKFNRQSDALEKYQTNVIDGFMGIYTEGGSFDQNCYPPGVIFGADGSVTFYPNHPVSLHETPVPVFGAPGRTNLIGVGKAYVIKAGDTPSSVATQFYDDWAQFSLIVAANNIGKLVESPRDNDSPYVIVPGTLQWTTGQTIYLPGTLTPNGAV